MRWEDFRIGSVNDVLKDLLRNGISFSWEFWGVKRLNRWTFFKDSEVEGLDPEFVAKLDLARSKAGIPFVITSGKRSQENNSAIGGVGDSSHLRGMAVDLRCASSQDRYKMVSALLSVGIKRIGIYNAHCHADADPTLLQEVIWIGESH